MTDSTRRTDVVSFYDFISAIQMACRDEGPSKVGMTMKRECSIEVDIKTRTMPQQMQRPRFPYAFNHSDTSDNAMVDISFHVTNLVPCKTQGCMLTITVPRDYDDRNLEQLIIGAISNDANLDRVNNIFAGLLSTTSNDTIIYVDKKQADLDNEKEDVLLCGPGHPLTKVDQNLSDFFNSHREG